MTNFGDRIGSIFSLNDWMDRVRERRAASASLRSLAHVDNATLKDIGMSRAELISVCFADPAGRRRNHV